MTIKRRTPKENQLWSRITDEIHAEYISGFELVLRVEIARKLRDELSEVRRCELAVMRNICNIPSK